MLFLAKMYSVMKRIFLPVAAAIFAISCGEVKNPDVVIEGNAYEQMMRESDQRDSALLEMVKTLNLIDENIGKISEHKSSLDVQFGDVEHRQDNRERILDEIQQIYEMMQQNKDKIAELNARLSDTKNKLRNSGSELKHSQELLAQYQLMIDNLNAKMTQKDQEIYTLKDALSKLDISLDSLKQEFMVQHVEMNKVYYAFGSRKELLYNKVIDKKGGFIGLGKSYQVKSDFNKDYFTAADAETLDSIDLFVKTATLLTTHRNGTYHFKGEGKSDRLIIDDKKAFWEASRFLVIEVEQ